MHFKLFEQSVCDAVEDGTDEDYQITASLYDAHTVHTHHYMTLTLHWLETCECIHNNII